MYSHIERKLFLPEHGQLQGFGSSGESPIWQHRSPNQEMKLHLAHRDRSIHNRERMLFRAGFGRYLAALEIIRQSHGKDL